MRPINRPTYDEANVPSVSGGRDNPPDRYTLVPFNGNPEQDLATLNAAADLGFRFVAVLPFNYVLMGNYKENK